MENKHVGYIVLGIALVLIFIVLIFQGALKEIVVAECGLPHAETCPMNQNINQQTWLALAIVGILIIIGLVLIFNKPKERIVIKKVTEKKKKLDLEGLDKKEKEVINLLEKENGTIFQADLMEKLVIVKV